MNALAQLLELSPEERSRRGLMHTPVEIAQQPKSWGLTFALFKKRRSELAEFLEKAGVGQASTTVFLIGAGTSDYIGQTLMLLLRRMWKCEVIAVPSTSLVTGADQYLVAGRRYLWISFSRSGDSPESAAVLENALEHHPEIHHVVVSCNAEGRMIRCASSESQTFPVVLDDAVNDRGLAMTSSFSNMAIFGQCMAHVHDLAPYEATLGRLVEAGKNFLPSAADEAAALAAENYERICFLGSGALQGVAVESALKVMELTAGKVLTMSESALGLRHGPMAALDHNTLVVSFLSSDPNVARYEKDLLLELSKKRLMRTSVVVGGQSGLALNGFADRYLSPGNHDALPDEYRSPVDVMFGQLLGLFFSLRHNLMPDRPSPDGVISRVVGNVRIYA